jgi:uncharacterized protein YpbB
MLPLCDRADLELLLDEIDRDLDVSPTRAVVDPERALELRRTRLRWRAAVVADLRALETTA